jgi:hypothetical protein
MNDVHNSSCVEVSSNSRRMMHLPVLRQFPREKMGRAAQETRAKGTSGHVGDACELIGFISIPPPMDLQDRKAGQRFRMASSRAGPFNGEGK